MVHGGQRNVGSGSQPLRKVDERLIAFLLSTIHRLSRNIVGRDPRARRKSHHCHPEPSLSWSGRREGWMYGSTSSPWQVKEASTSTVTLSQSKGEPVEGW